MNSENPTIPPNSTQDTTNNPNAIPIPSAEPNPTEQGGAVPTPPPPVPCVRKRKPARNASDVWNHFKKVDENGEDPRCICKHCGTDYACDPKRNGTSTLWNHVRNQCKRSPLRIDKKQKLLAFEKKDGEGNLLAIAFSKDAVRNACTRMIVLDELPFKFVEGVGFQYFCMVACPKYRPPSRTTIARDVLNLYSEEKSKLKSLLLENAKRVSLTTDTWTSIQNVNYMVLTAHFIDSDWNLHKRILNFTVIPNHRGNTIGKLIETCLNEWGISKIFTITVDNASSNDTALTYVKNKLLGYNGCVLNGEFLHVRCCAHILNLIVNDGMKELNSSIMSIRKAVKYVRSSPSRFDKFKECALIERIESKSFVLLDVPTRWNSTYLMLESALKFIKAFERMEDDDNGYSSYFIDDGKNDGKKVGAPTSSDWENARVFVKFLKFFYDATLKFSGSLVVTSTYPFHEMFTILSELKSTIESGDHMLRAMAGNMKAKYDKYWGSIDKINKLLIIAVVLDPRYKLEYVAFNYSFMFGDLAKDITTTVKDVFIRLYEIYSDENPIVTRMNDNVGKSGGVVENRNGPMILSDRVAAFSQMRKQKDVVEIRNEVDRYLLDPLEDPENSDLNVLHWWRDNSGKYPILAKLAKDVFAIQVSTVASESAFSTGGRVVDPFRSSLTPKMVEALICTQNWLKDGEISFYKDPTVEELEFYEALEAGKCYLQFNLLLI